MRQRHIGISLAAMAFAAWAPTAGAQESREDRFRAWDDNRDNRLEMGEMRENRANFRAMDCNKDGYLTMYEWVRRYECNEEGSSWTPPPAAQEHQEPQEAHDEYSRLDTNRDGSLQYGEWRAGAEAFRRVDRNNDGVVGRDEYGNQLDPNSVEGRYQTADLNNDGVVTRGEWRGDNRTFLALDLNRDGALSLEEYGRETPTTGDGWSQRFDTLDRNQDGYLSRYEWRGEQVAFASADSDNDNVVSRGEYFRVHGLAWDDEDEEDEDTRYSRFENLDDNDDGYLSRWEWRGEGLGVAFNDADLNRDGRVSREEFQRVAGWSGPWNRADERFADLDRNNDGRLSRGEWRGQSVDFRVADLNRDNGVSLQEYRRIEGAQSTYDARDARFDALDRNRDGRVTRSEWSGESVPFNIADANGDRILTRDEYRTFDDRYYDDRGSYRRISYDPREERFAAYDRNRDGRLTRREWREERASFDILDLNRDGRLTLGEYRNRSGVAGVFQSWDLNRNGLVDRNEWRSTRQVFDRLDANRDGVLTQNEFIEM